jgi:putative membrane protein
MSRVNRFETWLVLGWLVALVLSGIGPKDRITWWMEVAPVLIAAPVLLWTSDRFPLSKVILFFVFLHGLVLMLGGHYTYAEVPLGFHLQELFGFERNPYDRIGHFMQGFVPALVAREILSRKAGLRGAWLFFLTVTVCLSISAVYEFLEWWAALILGQDADAFLGTQGDPWDTQWDMFLALLGALSAQVLIRPKA